MFLEAPPSPERGKSGRKGEERRELFSLIHYFNPPPLYTPFFSVSLSLSSPFLFPLSIPLYSPLSPSLGPSLFILSPLHHPPPSLLGCFFVLSCLISLYLFLFATNSVQRGHSLPLLKCHFFPHPFFISLCSVLVHEGKKSSVLSTRSSTYKQTTSPTPTLSPFKKKKKSPETREGGRQAA